MLRVRIRIRKINIIYIVLLVVAFTGFIVLSVDAKKEKEFDYDKFKEWKKWHNNDNDDDDDNDKAKGDVIKIPHVYTWNYKLDDGILTYSIKNNDKLFNAIIDLAMADWEDAMGNTILLKKVDNAPFNFGGADIKFSHVKSLKDCDECYGKTDRDSAVVGATTFLDYYMSGNDKTLYNANVILAGRDLIQNIRAEHPEYEKADVMLVVKQTITHEIGHALGLGHANSKQSLMYHKGGDDINTEITDCEVYNVFLTNGFIDLAAQIEDDYADKYNLDTIKETANKICEIK